MFHNFLSFFASIIAVLFTTVVCHFYTKTYTSQKEDKEEEIHRFPES